MSKIFVLLLLFFPLTSFAQEKVVDIDSQKSLLELRSDDLIDSDIVYPEFLNADGKFEKLPAVIQYYYADLPLDPAKGTPVQDDDFYSSRLLVSPDHYRVYASDSFVYADGTWRTISSAQIEPSAFDAVMYDRIDPTLGDLLGGVFHAHAQTTYSESADGFTGCSWSANSYPWGSSACDNADTTDHTSAHLFSWSSLWENRSVFLAFDTSFLTEAPETSVLHLFYNDTWDSDVNTTVWATKGNQASVSDLTIDDMWAYELSGGTEITIVSDNYEEHTADVSGFTESGDYTKVAVISNDLYTESGSVTNSEMVAWYSSEQSGTDYDPYLEIVASSGTTTPPTSTTTIATSTYFALTITDSVYWILFSMIALTLLIVIFYLIYPA